MVALSTSSRPQHFTFIDIHLKVISEDIIVRGADAMCSGNDFCVNIIPGKEMPLFICN